MGIDMKCTKCRNELLPGGNVCEICGQVMEVEKEPEDNYDYSQFHSRPVIGIIGIFGCLIMIMSNFFVILSFENKERQDVFEFTNFGGGHGAIIVFISIFTLILIICKLRKIALIPTAIIVSWLTSFASWVSSISEELSKPNEFYQWQPNDYYVWGPGFYLLIIGIIFVIVNAFFPYKRFSFWS